MANTKGELPFDIIYQHEASLEVLRLLVVRTPATVKITDDGEELPLPLVHFACNQHAYVGVVRYLLAIDPTAVKTANNDGNLPLFAFAPCMHAPGIVGRGAGFGGDAPHRCQNGQQ
jgi:hypothetical protein